VYIVGTETLFNIDTLRQVHDDGHPLFLALGKIPAEHVQPKLADIFLSFVRCTRRYRNALFGQSSTHTPVAVAEQLHDRCFSFFDSCQNLLGVPNPTIMAWQARLRLLTVVEEENLLSSSRTDDQTSLKTIVPLVLSVLESDCLGKTIQCFRIFSSSGQ
jgi:hypothetical protein